MIDKKLLERALLKGSLYSWLVFLAIFSFSEFIAFQMGEKNEFNGFTFSFTLFIAIVFFLRSVLFDLFVEEDGSKALKTSGVSTDQDRPDA